MINVGKYSFYILLPFLLTIPRAWGQTVSVSTEPFTIASPVRYNPWEQSLNPAGIHYTAIDSLLNAWVGYNSIRTPFPLSDQPDKEQHYGASVRGYQRIGPLQLTAGISWQQNRKEGQAWNLLIQPDYIVTAGDTLLNPQRTEQYQIYGKASYAFSPLLTAGLGGMYTAIDNRDLSPEKLYEGDAHTAIATTGLIHEGRRLHLGLSFVYIHTSELLSYNENHKERLYTYPMGYFIPMDELTEGGMLRSSAGNSTMFHSTGNNWQAAFQAEWCPEGWNWFNEVTAGRKNQQNNPNNTNNMLGWKERFTSFRYQSRLTRGRGRWTHLLSPELRLQWGTSDRIVQHPDPDAISSAWITFGSYHLASRQQTAIRLRYELARDYSPEGRTLAWEAAAGWYHQQEKLYSHPFTYAQNTGVFQSEIAFFRAFVVSRKARINIRPAFSLATGQGVEEEVTLALGYTDVKNNYSRSYGRVSQDFAARTATRLGLGLQTEYRRLLTNSIHAGICLQATLDKVVYNSEKIRGSAGVAIHVWF